MTTKKKKLEILYIDDIRSISNNLLSTKSNHYLQNMLFSLRLIFRYNADGLDDIIDLYYYIVDVLDNNILLDFDELKILIYRITDFVVNIDDYNIHGNTLVTETASNLLQSLYLELETYRLVDKKDEDKKWESIILDQLKNQVVDFKELLRIYELTDDEEVSGIVSNILENNYPYEFALYKARYGILEV